MNFFTLDPEVAGELGPSTEMDASVHPPRVTKLHYIIDAWLGDDLVQSFPCYLATEELRNRLEALNASGGKFAPAIVTVSEDFEELNPGVTVPRFHWLLVDGVAGQSDFGLTYDSRLVASERVIRVMCLSHCGKAPFEATIC